MYKQLLDYWYSIEFFLPNWPVNEKEDIDLRKKPLPWPHEENNPKISTSYDVYLGKAVAYDLIVWGLECLNLVVEDSPIERDQSKVCVCALKVDENGKYVAESFAFSSFAWALGFIVKAQNFNAKLSVDVLEALRSQVNNNLVESLLEIHCKLNL